VVIAIIKIRSCETRVTSKIIESSQRMSLQHACNHLFWFLFN
jgi:hypothetical protein